MTMVGTLIMLMERCWARTRSAILSALTFVAFAAALVAAIAANGHPGFRFRTC